MRDVAAVAGVSVKTVSRVLNAEPNVSEELKERVRRAAATLNYELNVYAGGLRRMGARTNAIGLMLESVDDAFSAAIHRGVETVTRRHSIIVLAQSFEEDADRERTVVKEFLRRRVDGLILTTVSRDQAYLSAEAARGTSIVFVDRPAVSVAFDSVVSCNFDGAVAATRHLLEHGHRRLAYVGGDHEIWTLRERLRGYFDELDRWGVPRSDVVALTGVHGEEGARTEVHRMLDGPQPPTAIFAAHNRMTVGVLRALHERGRQHDVAMVGFDDVQLLDLLEPGVTVVAQDPHRLGELAAERLLARMAGNPLELETLTVPTTLIERGSGEIPGPFAA
ncbi:LacI family DNA-binding transcriptional regulator [Cellulomonas wangsupingiae]|uniref:LacI family transcriptional regulator n=1 Tax=Cellulomonas wangsupingiae TaxID=2968085 RepID=A0ABY5KBV0_9CELL|nr:LacI family DNA-binding transcriptional regulator [Cellulomonas wangsupingiae]UUI66456.1 LacI family transcriptional regulator [Cellulomonas wangsupingiae]